MAVAVVVLAVAVIGAGIVLLRRDPHPTSARLGHEGTRTFDHAPDDLPEGLVPADATEVVGTAARGGRDWTAAVSFVTDMARPEISSFVDDVVTGAEFVFRQRSYDDVTLQAAYDGPDGSVLTITYQTLSEGTGTAVVLQGRLPASGGS